MDKLILEGSVRRTKFFDKQKRIKRTNHQEKKNEEIKSMRVDAPPFVPEQLKKENLDDLAQVCVLAEPVKEETKAPVTGVVIHRSDLLAFVPTSDYSLQSFNFGKESNFLKKDPMYLALLIQQQTKLKDKAPGYINMPWVGSRSFFNDLDKFDSLSLPWRGLLALWKKQRERITFLTYNNLPVSQATKPPPWELLFFMLVGFCFCGTRDSTAAFDMADKLFKNLV